MDARIKELSNKLEELLVPIHQHGEPGTRRFQEVQAEINRDDTRYDKVTQRRTKSKQRVGAMSTLQQAYRDYLAGVPVCNEAIYLKLKEYGLFQYTLSFKENMDKLDNLVCRTAVTVDSFTDFDGFLDTLKEYFRVRFLDTLPEIVIELENGIRAADEVSKELKDERR